jgi:hypothetical protein
MRAVEGENPPPSTLGRWEIVGKTEGIDQSKV